MISSVSRSVTARDKRICIDCYEHRFLTTHQVARLHFGSEATARARLLQLWRLRVLDRFRPERRTGSAPWYYVLDQVGVAIVEAQLGVERLLYDRRKALTQVYSPRLAHHTAVNDFFACLAEAARTSDGFTLATWLGERACEAHWRGAIHPDGFGVLQIQSGALSFLLELDRGTENGRRLTDKLRDAAELAGADDAPDAILFCFPTREREAAQRGALSGSPIPVATAVFDDHMTEPEAEIWLPVGATRRVRITDMKAKQ